MGRSKARESLTRFPFLQELRVARNGRSGEKKCLSPYLPPRFFHLHFSVCCLDNILSLAYWLVFLLLPRTFFINWCINFFYFSWYSGFSNISKFQFDEFLNLRKRTILCVHYHEMVIYLYLFMIYLLFTHYKCDGVLIISISMKTSPSRNLNAPTGGSKDRPASVRSG